MDHRNQAEALPPNSSSTTFDQSQKHRVPTDPSHYGRNSRSHSMSANDEEARIHIKPRKSVRGARPQVPNNDLPRVTKMKTNDSALSAPDVNIGAHYSRRERRPSRTSIDLEADSHASRSSQETEEDVCFPMLREHVKINGIDFDEIEDFINEERQRGAYMEMASRTQDEVPTSNLSNNAKKYSPKNILNRATSIASEIRPRVSENPYYLEASMKASDSSDDYLRDEKRDDESSEVVRFGGTNVDGKIELPVRFSFFHSDNEETIHSPDIPSLVQPGKTFSQIFKNGVGTWWLDCTCPTDEEMKTLAKAFGIHPLTAEDIRMQETREKVELFHNYYFVCFHTFEPDKESEDYLEPINVYIVVFREGVLTFHFSPILHPANVRRRVRQLRDYVVVSADWIGYALIDDITDGFAPVITGIEYEADAIEDSVLDSALFNFSSILRKIGQSRRKVMTLMRLLSNKADVIKMFAKRCLEEDYLHAPHGGASRANLASLAVIPGDSDTTAGPNSASGMRFGPNPGAPSNMMSHFQSPLGRVQPRADIALYLGDIQDHVVTMFQNLSAYEKIFSRAHSNYLAQLQVESFNSNLMVTKILGNVTLIGTLFLPLNVITGLFGMNVNVPGQGKNNWFYGILGCMALLVLAAFTTVKWWLSRMERREVAQASDKKSIKTYSLKNRKREAVKSIISFPKYD